MKKILIVAGLAGVLMVVPIWYFLLYTILSAIQPDRLVWFLFWIYIPASLFVQVVEKIANEYK